LGKGFFGEWMTYCLGDILLIIALGLYVLASRRRLHPAHVVAAPVALGVQAITGCLLSDALVETGRDTADWALNGLIRRPRPPI